MKYGFWKLLRNQWSWKNDRGLLIIQPIITATLTLLYHMTGSVNIEPLDFYWYGLVLVFLGITLTGLGFYHLVKLIAFTLFCWLVVSESKKGNQKVIDIYYEMMKWRQ